MIFILTLLFLQFLNCIACDSAICATVSAACAVTCACDLPVCECCPECVSCLGDDYEECCDCFDICGSTKSYNKTLGFEKERKKENMKSIENKELEKENMKSIENNELEKDKNLTTDPTDPCLNITGTYPLCWSFTDSISGTCKFQMLATISGYKSTISMDLSYSNKCHCDIGHCKADKYSFTGTCVDASVNLDGHGEHLTGTFINKHLTLHNNGKPMAESFIGGNCTF